MSKGIFGKSLFMLKGAPGKKPSQLVIFFADVAGSTQLYESLGDRVAHECIVESLNLISRRIEHNNGVVVEVIGDEIMAYFENPLEAVRSACDLTAESIEGLPEYTRSLCRPFGRVEVKGKSNPLNAMEVIWSLDDATDVFVPQNMAAATEINAELILQFCGKEIVVTKDNTPFVFGRHIDSNLVVNAETVSRSHAQILCRYGEFVLLDTSTNGTYINTASGPHISGNMEMHLLHREWYMIGDGTISLGRPISDDNPLLITFSLKALS